MNHDNAKDLGVGIAKEILHDLELLASDGVCPLCASAAISIYLLSNVLPETNTEAQIEDYLENVMLAIFNVWKKGRPEDRPVDPDRSRMN